MKFMNKIQLNFFLIIGYQQFLSITICNRLINVRVSYEDLYLLDKIILVFILIRITMTIA